MKVKDEDIKLLRVISGTKNMPWIDESGRSKLNMMFEIDRGVAKLLSDKIDLEIDRALSLINKCSEDDKNEILIGFKGNYFTRSVFHVIEDAFGEDSYKCDAWEFVVNDIANCNKDLDEWLSVSLQGIVSEVKVTHSMYLFYKKLAELLLNHKLGFYTQKPCKRIDEDYTILQIDIHDSIRDYLDSTDRNPYVYSNANASRSMMEAADKLRGYPDSVLKKYAKDFYIENKLSIATKNLTETAADIAKEIKDSAERESPCRLKAFDMLEKFKLMNKGVG